jgi:hypothetical protein
MVNCAPYIAEVDKMFGRPVKTSRADFIPPRARV